MSCITRSTLARFRHGARLASARFMSLRSRFLFVALLSVASLAACTTTVRPPSELERPESVVLVTHGRSSSLILPAEEEKATRWAYGDWRFYALGEKGVLDALAALFIPTRSALGRQVIDPAPPAIDALVDKLGIGIDEAFEIRVEQAAVRALQERLEALFAAARETLHFNPGPRLEFVVHPVPYTIFHNSNSVVADWLEELGCSVRGFPLRSKWRVESGRQEIVVDRSLP